MNIAKLTGRRFPRFHNAYSQLDGPEVSKHSLSITNKDLILRLFQIFIVSKVFQGFTGQVSKTYVILATQSPSL